MKLIKTLCFIILMFNLYACKQLKMKNNDEKTYLALGDSYTIGESVLEQDRFPVILMNDLNNQNKNYNTPKIIAGMGITIMNPNILVGNINIYENNTDETAPEAPIDR